jgi:hypothetical protein
MYKTKYLQVSTQMAMDNNPSPKRAGVVFFALRLSYRLSFFALRLSYRLSDLQNNHPTLWKRIQVKV